MPVSPTSITTKRPSGLPSFPKNRQGFALLITITLLAFLVLLLVSLATLTRVETQISYGNQTQAQARQNALLALNIAIGQLQKYAGPDARVTARSEATSTSVLTNPYYTGVWKVSDASVAPAMWLVSGSEQADNATKVAQLLSAALDPSVDTVTDDTLFLVGNRVASNPSTITDADRARRVKVTKQNITAAAGTIPGVAASETPRVGRYAWWVGDEGVKASLALKDRAESVTYAPWDVPTQSRRLRQQLGSGPSYFRHTSATTTLGVEKAGFDPLQKGALGNVVTDAQLKLLDTATAPASFFNSHFYDFTAVASNVQANTRTDQYRGLMEDLSINPGALGAAFEKYTTYNSYMEKPGSTTATLAAVPAIVDASSPRRRYNVTARSTAAAAGLPEISFNVAPVISEFILQYYVRRTAVNTLTVKARVYVGLWNPYSSAIVPPADLSLEVEGLDKQPLEVSSPSDAGSIPVNVDMSNGASPMFEGKKLIVKLPFGPSYKASASSTWGKTGELSSWFPGRKYSWASLAVGQNGANSNVLGFYSNSLDTVGWNITTPNLTGSGLNLRANLPAVTLKILLKSGSDVLATYTPDAFPADIIPDVENTTDGNNGATAGSGDIKNWRFAFAFRLKQPSKTDGDRSWLTTFDPRAETIPGSSTMVFDDVSGSLPSQYKYTIKTTDNLTDYLIYRPQGFAPRQVSVFNDVSVFELPRLPLMSLGELQHVQVKDKRPFFIGNSWGANANLVFDRFFFSGLPSLATTPTVWGTPNLGAGQPLPNWNLVPTDPNKKADDIRADSYSSKHLLQQGGFNVNSVSKAAWRAVLSNVRFNPVGSATSKPPSIFFSRADIVNDPTSTPNPSSPANMGTQDADTATVDEAFTQDKSLATSGNFGAPAFFKFPQSAQEVYFWADPASGSLASNVRTFSAEAFRYGVRGYAVEATTGSATNRPAIPAFTTAVGGKSKPANMMTGANIGSLTTDQIEVLASEIATRVQARIKDKGPFLSMEEFLGPTSGSNPSLIEDAIEAARMNADQIRPVPTVPNTTTGLAYWGLSSLTITQADILTALAPYLHTRSDTFKIRSYGEVVNPVTGQSQGKAWAEALVQRLPELVNSSDSISQPSDSGMGRKFKIIQFRWLTQSDI